MTSPEKYEVKTFTTDNYTHELVELGKAVNSIADEALRDNIIDRVNNMQAILRPIVDIYLKDNPQLRSQPVSIEDLYEGPLSRG